MPSISGYIYKIEELSTGRIYIGVRSGSFDPDYFGSPNRNSDLFKAYAVLSLFEPSFSPGEKRRIFASNFYLEILEVNEDCSLSPFWSKDKTLTLEGAYKTYIFPECMESNGGFNRNIDRVGGFPFIEDCKFCTGSVGSHRGDCNQATVCSECSGKAGKHRAVCSGKKLCAECGTSNQNHKKDLGDGQPCSRFTPGLNNARSSELKVWAQTAEGQAQLSRAGKTDAGKKKPEAWVEWRREIFTESNPMKDPAVKAKVKITRQANLPRIARDCATCGHEMTLIGKSTHSRRFCTRLCYVNSLKGVSA